MTAHEINRPENDSEVSLLDILIFLKESWKVIVFAGILGLLASSLYLFLTPNQYEAVAKIEMARVPGPNDSKSNIEDPAALIARMSLPNSFNNAVISSCGMENQLDGATKLTKVVKLTIPKGAVSVVELKVTLSASELANKCATSIVESISKFQAQKVAVIQEANQAKLNKVNERITEDKSLLARALQPGAPISVTYYSLLSNIRYLEDHREYLSAKIDSIQLQDATQQPLIYVSDKPIHPQKAKILLTGMLGGLFFGLLAALTRQMIPKLKSKISVL
jgi:uncharacterized protein involved in exopolysaccharide biosynthesis